jgi:uncharacterized protein
MADFLGRFLWYEYLAAEPAEAQTFYTKVVGWGTEVFPSPKMRYDLWTRKGGVAIGGLMELPEEPRKAGMSPHWLVYLGTPGVDRTLSQARDLGASLLMGPMDVPDVGRIAVLQDPQGATFALYQPADAPTAEAPPKPGDFSWHELATSDPVAAFAFYSELFGWVKTSAMDMGPAGIYQMYGRRSDAPLGGIYSKPSEMRGPSAWLPYAMVPDLGAATRQIRARGGSVVNGPMEVPGGDWIVVGIDAQGAMFALHQRAGVAAKQAAPRKPAPGKRTAAKEIAKKTAKKKAARKKSAARKTAKKPVRKRPARGRKATRKPARPAARRKTNKKARKAPKTRALRRRPRARR